MKSKFIGTLMGAVATLSFSSAQACGGFFCSLLPIDQAGEQIVFRVDGDQITTMVQIQYAGDADDFGWVLPVPSVPELSLGSDTTVRELERATRPSFALEQTGEACWQDFITLDTTRENAPIPSPTGIPDARVVIEKQVEVGPFDALVISGDDSTAVASWLDENNLDLSDRGAELLAPYIEAGMKFVVLKLQSSAESGDIQPIIMEYTSDKPMIPIKLTAVAAQEDMGIITWVLGDDRAVPENYYHVTPNLAKLNWYVGGLNAYSSYQNLITEAMNEADSGHGFATDMAGEFDFEAAAITDAEMFEEVLAQVENFTDVDFIAYMVEYELGNLFLYPELTDMVSSALGLEASSQIDLYAETSHLTEEFSVDELAAARVSITETITEKLIKPIKASVALFDGDKYLTRLYTTLSADEMTLDPTFVFNSNMADQVQRREANLHSVCESETTSWTLTLGEGTGRNGEVVAKGTGIPFAPQAETQKDAYLIEKTFASDTPQVVVQNDPQLESEVSDESDGGLFGGATTGMFFFMLFSLLGLRRLGK